MAKRSRKRSAARRELEDQVASHSAGLAPPVSRRLQIYAFDPSLDLDPHVAAVNHSTISIGWETLQPGPVGEYVEIVDVDPASDTAYQPVDLDHAYLLARDGHAPSEGLPQFHQQMVYAVAMMTIANFERALGRRLHWSPRLKDESGEYFVDPADTYVPRLRIYPHGLRQANAYYSPNQKTLQFGYFRARSKDPRDGLPSGMVFSCLSHDIIAHETTHAILDGLHRRLLEATNPDSLAFHEAFADLVAIFQHFTLPGVLEHEISLTRGNLRDNTKLATLAIQFGHATGRKGALRDALKRPKPDPTLIDQTTEPHARGAIFVAAVFQAFLTIYEGRIADLLRLASGGTGVLKDRHIPPDLVGRLADEARKVAGQMLTMGIRALDYLPPVDVTFGDYIRALITSDSDLVPEDSRNYRASVLRSFRDWGIYPYDVRTLSVASLRWKSPGDDDQDALRQVLPPVHILRLMTDVHEYDSEFAHGARSQTTSTKDAEQRLEHMYRDFVATYATREPAAETSDQLHDLRRREFLRERQFAAFLHQVFAINVERIQDTKAKFRARELFERLHAVLGIDFSKPEDAFEVHAVRPTYRVHEDGRTRRELVVLITQKKIVEFEHPTNGEKVKAPLRGGCTLLIDPQSGRVEYSIIKRIGSDIRSGNQLRFWQDRLTQEGWLALDRYPLRCESYEPLRAREPLAALHAPAD